MPPLLALTLAVIFSIFALRRFAQDPIRLSRASWLPIIWIFFVASRFPSQWLALLGLPNFGGSLEEGSTLDAIFFLLLIVIGTLKLHRRNVQLASIARENPFLVLFFIYCFAGIFWSDFPFVSFKRWVKTLGHPVMALLILTEADPALACRLVFKRAAFIIIPLSVVFIKYFPEFGRGFDQWTGIAINRGIMLTKNELGSICVTFGIFFVWQIVLVRRYPTGYAKRRELAISVGFLLIILWLLKLADSAMALMSFSIGSVIVIGLGFRFTPKRYFGAAVVGTLVLLIALQFTIGIYEPVLGLLGRNATLTDRTEVWADALSLMDSPILGTGFESFWLGHRLEIMWSKWFWHPNQAHNGYIETYLNLGFCGIAFLTIAILATFRKISMQLLSDLSFARFQMALFLTILLYNFTEATFKAVALLYTLFYLVAIKLPQKESNEEVWRLPAETSYTQNQFSN